MAISNPNNGYIPKVGERVRFVGACHPRCVGKVCEVTSVYEEDGQWWFEEKHLDPLSGDYLFSGGVLGGVEPAGDAAIDTF